MTTQIQENQTVGEIVARDYRTAQLFRSYGIDFCCGGGRTVEEACRKKSVDPEEIYEAIRNIDLNASGSGIQNRFGWWSLDFLIGYIIENHHRYVRTKSDEIEGYARKVANVHGQRHPELLEIRDLFVALKPDLLDHLHKEEQIVFPFIRELLKAEEENTPAPERPAIEEEDATSAGATLDPVELMEQEHEEVGDAMRKIAVLTDNFTPPSDACTTYRLLFKNLEAFRNDLHQHVHLENNILFPRALNLEQKLK